MAIAISILIASQIRNKHRVERKKKKPIITIQKQTKTISKTRNKETGNVIIQLQQKVNWTPMFRIPKRTKKNQLKKQIPEKPGIKTHKKETGKKISTYLPENRNGLFSFLKNICQFSNKKRWKKQF